MRSSKCKVCDLKARRTVRTALELLQSCRKHNAAEGDSLQRQPPPWAKTRKSLCVIPLPEELVPELWLWKQECPDSSPEAFIFPNEDGGFVDTGNYLKRVLKKLARDIGLPKLTFQVIRCTIATLGRTKGTVKSVQGMLRHNRTATTTEVYMQEMPEGVRATVRAICAELMAVPNHGSGQRVWHHLTPSEKLGFRK